MSIKDLKMEMQLEEYENMINNVRDCGNILTDTLTLNNYQIKSTRTLNFTTDKKDNINQMLMGIGGESGEITDIFKKHWYQGHELDTSKVIEEIGDTLFYIAGLCTVLGVPLSDVASGNINKLKKRYPRGFEVEDSVARVDEDDLPFPEADGDDLPFPEADEDDLPF